MKTRCISTSKDHSKLNNNIKQATVPFYTNLILKQNKCRFFNTDFNSYILRSNFILKILYPLTQKMKCQNTTLSMTIALMDAFLSKTRVNEDLIPSIGVTALSLISKLNETTSLGIGPDFYSEMQSCLEPRLFPILEKCILESVDFNISIVTPLHFIEVYLEMGILKFEYSIQKDPKKVLKTSSIMDKIFLCLCLDYQYNLFDALTIANCMLVYMEELLCSNDIRNLKSKICFSENESFDLCLRMLKSQCKKIDFDCLFDV